MGTSKWNVLALAGGLAMVLGACSEDLAPALPDAGVPDGDGGVVTPSRIKTTDNGDGSFTTIVDAHVENAIVGFDFQTRDELSPSGGAVWDMAFRRFEIKLNGGASGTGGNVEVAILPLADFDTLVRAPAGGWITDRTGATAFNDGDGWYVYNPQLHLLEPRDIVYVVRSAEGAYFKVKMLGYYDDAGGSGHPAFRWAPVEAPPADDSVVVEAPVAGTWTYLSVLNGVVSVADPATSNAWDLAFSRTQIATNSGSSGRGLGGARLAPADETYATVKGATTLGYAVDAPAAGGSSANPVLSDWFAGDPTTPRPLVYLVRTAGGAYAKVQITAWANGTFTLRVASISRDVLVESATVDTSGATVYYNLRQARTVASAAGDWDLAFTGKKIATNSGTSGSGRGGGADPGVPDIDSVVTAANSSYVVDVQHADGSYNPELADWFEEGVNEPRQKAYLVRTADGGHVKLQVTTFTGGNLSFDFAYAGAGRNDFPIPDGI